MTLTPDRHAAASAAGPSPGGSSVYQDPRSPQWAHKCTVPPERLGRCFDPETAIARWGADLVQPLIDGYLTADDLARAVVEDIIPLGGKGRQMIEQAVEEGIETVPDAPASLVELFKVLDNPPDWVDWEQLRRGSIAYFRAGPLVSFGFTCAVIAGSERAYGIARPIVFSGRLSGNAYIRAKETTRWLVAAIRPDGLRRDAEGFKLSARVRILHAMVRRACSNSPEWDWNDWGMPLCHTDGLYAASYDFPTAMVDALTNVGVRFSDQEVEDIYAVWRYVGWIMGVPDHLLHRSAAEGRLFSDIYLALDPGPDHESRELLKNLIELATAEDGPELDVFPKFVTAMFPPLRLRKLLYGFTRYWSGTETADQLGIPDTFYKHVPKVVKPIISAKEATRRFYTPNDEKAAYSTLRILGAAAKATAGETTIATPEAVMENIRTNGPNFSGERGRSHLTARRS